MEEDIERIYDVIVWLNFYDCLNTMFSQYKSTHWSLLQRLRQNINAYKKQNCFKVHVNIYINI